MKESLEYVYFRNMGINEWLNQSSKNYDAESWKKQEELEDIPFEDIGKTFKEITDYVLVGVNINPDVNNDVLIEQNEKIDYVDGVEDFIEKLAQGELFGFENWKFKPQKGL